MFSNCPMQITVGRRGRIRYVIMWIYFNVGVQKSSDLEEVRELDYGRIPSDTVSKKRTVLSSVKVIAFALSAIVIAIVFESRLHIF